MKRLTKELLQERSDLIHNSKYLILGDYTNNSTKIKIKHLECNNIFEQQPNNHIQGKGCIFCSGNKKSTKIDLQNKSNTLYNGDYIILGEYINNLNKILIKHIKCNTEFECLPINHLNGKGGCVKCFKNIKKTKEILQEESDKIHKSEYIILGDYINTDTKIEIKHKICGNIFSQTPDKHLHNNKCPICFGKNKLNKEILQERSNLKYNNEYEILGEYANNSTKILIRHKLCGSEYYQVPNNHLSDRTCFKCGDNMSKGEMFIKDYLDSNKIEYLFNNKIDGCKFIKSLRFDFYLPKLDICIEYDGEQHFKPVSYFGGIDGFNLTKKRDSVKNMWCEYNKIRLIRISYKENIKDKLNKLFNI